MHAERAHIYAMADARVICVCGAIYEVFKTKGASRDARPFKCVLCDSYSHGTKTILVNFTSSGVLTRIASNV